jgi:hypothetical protein
LNFPGLAVGSEVWHSGRMKKPRKAKKEPAKKKKPQLDANQMAARLVQATIQRSEK